jgi:hypothetical protein
MPEHKVKTKLQVIELSKRGSAIRFEIYSDKTKIGDIQIGKGSFGWKSGSKKDFQTRDWTTFCNMLNQYFYGD